jgi:hypothetical protein
MGIMTFLNGRRNTEDTEKPARTAPKQGKVNRKKKSKRYTEKVSRRRNRK